MIAICGFFCGRGVLLMVPMGAMGPFWPGDGSFRAVEGGLRAVSKVESSARARLAFQDLS